MPTIVLIDDEPGAMKYYVKALTILGFHVIEIESADAAWEFFEQPHPEVTAVILDIMMPPGQYLEHEDHGEGLRTGLFVYRRIVDQECRWLGTNQQRPTAVLTNVSNPDTLTWLQMIAFERERSRTFRLWQKLDVSPMHFAEQFSRWLRELGVLT